jgi:adenine-specific DNA methylase
MSAYPKRLIEVDLPIKKISAHARREKSIRHGHISTLHIWWARRPLAACRAVLCAALWPDPADPLCPQKFRDDACRLVNEFASKAASDKALAQHCSHDVWKKWQALAKTGSGLDASKEPHWNVLRFALLDFIADFANWDSSTVPEYLATARALTQSAHESLGGAPGTRPLVVDPFAGGGSIPLEALRIGADAFASDLNPVAVLLNKVVLEYIPKYGQRLADEIRELGAKVLTEAQRELSSFYPDDPDGSTPIAYLWARTIRCEGPGCGVEVPILTQPLIAKRENGDIVVSCMPDELRKNVETRLLKSDGDRRAAEPTVRRSSVSCPACGYTTPAASVRQQFVNRKGGVDDARLLVVATLAPNGSKRYREPTDGDLALVERAKLRVSKARSRGTSGIPEEPLPYLRSIFNIHLLGVNEWGQLFTARQSLLLTKFATIIAEIAESAKEDAFLQATITCLGLALDKMADFHTSLTTWIHQGEKIGHTFSRQALGIIWDFTEANPFADISGSWERCIGYISEFIEH